MKSFEPLMEVDTTLADGGERLVCNATSIHFVVEMVEAHVAGSALGVVDDHDLFDT